MEYGAYKASSEEFFTSPPDKVELFQPQPPSATFEAIETSYFGFNIPAHRINCVIYHWFHPKFALASGGIYIYRGVKRSQLDAECFDWRQFMPMPINLDDQRYPTGVRIRMLNPRGEFQIQYSDVSRNTHLDLKTVPIMPLAVRSTGNHFTQAVRTRGTLILLGTEYKIDGYYTRDRSWAENRSERPQTMPPLTWITGVFGEESAFHVMAYDSIERRPELRHLYPSMQLEKNHLWGYLYLDGRLLGVRKTEKYTRCEADGLTPTGYDLRIEDEEGGIHDITGHAIARQPVYPWANMHCYVTLNRWQCGQHVGYGDAQEMLFGDHLHKCRP
jgi:hypothetical protein